MVDPNKNNGASVKDAPILHQMATTLSAGALAFAFICTMVAVATCRLVIGALESLGVMTSFWYLAFAGTIILVAMLFWPAHLAYKFDRSAKVALSSGDIVQARIDIFQAREKSFVTFGWGFFVLIILGTFYNVFVQ